MNQKKTIVNYFNGELKIDLENYFKKKWLEQNLLMIGLETIKGPINLMELTII